jgi:hypothetical protein
MLKKFIISLSFILVFSVIAFAQENESTEKEKPKFGFNMNLAIGLSSYEDSNKDQLAFQKFGIFPEFTYGKWGLGLDLSFELDGDFHLRDLDNDGKPDRWSYFKDYVQRIYYLRYGHKGDPLYGRIGAFSSYTLGHGLVMERFSNTLFYPQVIQLGLNLDIDGNLFDFPYIGMESVVDDILDWDIMGIRVYSRPFQSISTPIVKDMKVGATIVTDLDNKEVPTEDPTPDNPASQSGITEYGLDIEAPLLERQDMSVIAYADWAKISGKGMGSWIGSTFTYKWVSVLGQLRFLGKQFETGFFGPLYEVERSTKYAGLDAIDQFYIGYLIGTQLALFNFVEFHFLWSDGINDKDEFNDPVGPRIQTGIGTAEGAFQKFDASIMYDKKDIDSFSEFFEEGNSLMRFTVGYMVGGATKIVFIHERAYSPYPPYSQTSRTIVETQISF